MIRRSEVEQIVARRIGPFLAEAGMSVGDGVNGWLTDPTRWAMGMLGYATATLTAVTDDDLTFVSPGAVDALLDLVELRALETVQGNLLLVDVQAGPVRESLSQIAGQLAAMVLDKRRQVAAMHRDLLRRPLAESMREATLRSL